MNRPEEFACLRPRLARGAKMIGVLESRRLASGDRNLGSNIERMIIERELEELEEEIYRHPGPLAPHLTPVSLKRQGAAEEK